MKPTHVSIVGGEPLVRFRELDEILPKLAGEGRADAGRDERRAADSRERGRRFRACRSASRSTGSQPEHDVRRAPATYDRILKHIEGHQITVHCTVTRQQSRPGYLTEFTEFWNAQPDVKRHLVQPLHAAAGRGVGRAAAAGGSRARRRGNRRALRGRLDKLRDMRPSVLEGYLHPPQESGVVHLCADDRVPVGGFDDENHAVPVRRRSGLQPVRVHGVGGARRGRPLQAAGRRLRAGQIYWASRKVGNGVRRLRGGTNRASLRRPRVAAGTRQRSRDPS